MIVLNDCVDMATDTQFDVFELAIVVGYIRDRLIVDDLVFDPYLAIRLRFCYVGSPSYYGRSCGIVLDTCHISTKRIPGPGQCYQSRVI